MNMYSKSILSKTMLIVFGIIGSTSANVASAAETTKTLPVKAHHKESVAQDFLASNVDKSISPAEDFFFLPMEAG